MRNPNYEQALKKSGIEFTYEDAVSLDKINATRGKQMQARLDPLDHSLIDQYAGMIEDGFDPPPLLLWKHGKSLLVPLDGNQRIAANLQVPVKNRLKAFSAYIVALDDLMVVDRLCWQFNNMVNGRRLSYEESMNHAIVFRRKYNQPLDKTAKEWGVKPWELERRTKALDIREIGAKKNIDSSHVSEDSIVNMAPLLKIGEDVLLKVLKVTAESGIGTEQVREIVSDIGKAKTLEAKMNVVEGFAKSDKVIQSKAATKGGKIVNRKGRMPREMLQKHLAQLEDLLDDYKEDAFKPVGKHDKERFAGSALFVVNRLIAVYGLGAFVKGQGVA